MHKIPCISIVGMTASGKTAVALMLAEEIARLGRGVTLISADSRQVYKDIPILSGADVPADFFKTNDSVFEHPFFQNQTGTIQLHGCSMLASSVEWSLGLFRQFALDVMMQAIADGRVVLIVGGTGLYQTKLFTTDTQVNVKPDPAWRKEASIMTLLELQKQLEAIDPNRLTAMNNSDSNNPRRLQRAIEIARAPKLLVTNKYQDLLQHVQQQIIGLQGSAKSNEIIKDRVIARINAGAIFEVEKCLQLENVASHLQTTLGFLEISQYLEGKYTKAELIDMWALHECQYAKRQMTWWKAQPSVAWYDV